MRIFYNYLPSTHGITSKYGGPVAFSMLKYKLSDRQFD
jgi:hypothetical protein